MHLRSLSLLEQATFIRFCEAEGVQFIGVPKSTEDYEYTMMTLATAENFVTVNGIIGRLWTLGGKITITYTNSATEIGIAMVVVGANEDL